MEKTRVLVTGASGFIGKHVVKRLCDGGYPVIVLVREEAGYQKAGDELVAVGDLRDLEGLKAALGPYAMGACIHLAWEGIPDYSFEMSERNLRYGIHILKLCRDLRIPHLVISGSCWEYKAPAGKVGEDWPVDDSTHFKAAKNSLRMMGHAFCKEYGIRFHWLRLFYVYGPGQREGSLIPYIGGELLRGRLPVLNGGNNRNDFIHVKDVAEAMVKTLEENPEEEVLNIGSGESTRVFDVLKMAEEEAAADGDGPGRSKTDGSAQGSAQNGPAADGPGVDFYADLGTVSAALKWRPEITLQEGIHEMMCFIEEELEVLTTFLY